MTNTTATEGKGGISPSQFAGTATTLRLSHLMEEQHRLGIAGRITQLREKSRWTQPEIAEQLGLTLRGYQKIEEKGTTKYERVEEIAAIHKVDPEWIWEGEDKTATPDLMATLSGSPELRAQLDRMEQMLVEALTALAELGVEFERRTVPAQRRPRSKRG